MPVTFEVRSDGILEIVRSGALGRAEEDASQTASIPMRTPSTGDYFVVVHASKANAGTVVACGNLAPPTR